VGFDPPLVFVRHGETDWNVSGRLQGRTDVPLNARGLDQAEAVGRALRGFSGLTDRVFLSSPLSRATETMRRMREALGLDPEAFAVDDRLSEMSFGRWEGLTFREIREREPGLMKVREADRWAHTPPGGESYVEVAARLKSVIDALDRPAVIVSHGGVARAALSLAGVDRAGLPEIRIQQGRALVIGEREWRWI